MEPLIQRLRAYALERVEASRGQIVANLRAKGDSGGGSGPLVLDVALPGAAYFSVAAGGTAEVLHLLGGEHVQVDRFIGASGGACSLFLILANQRSSEKGPCQCPNSELLLRSYLEYGESEGRGPVSRGFNATLQVFAGVSQFWEHKYRELLSETAAFDAIREKAYVAVAAKPVRKMTASRRARGQQGQLQPTPAGATSCPFEAASDNYIFHNFDTEEQAVQAFVATGEATAKGVFRGIRGLAEEGVLFAHSGPGGSSSSMQATLPPSFCDGGRPVGFWGLGGAGQPGQQRSGMLYYYTMFSQASDALFCTPGSVERLFKKGVDRTIECLCSERLVAPEGASDGRPAAPDRMAVILPGQLPAEQLSAMCRGGDLESGAFVSVRERIVREV